MPVLRAFPARSVVALLLLVGCPRPQIVAGPPPDPGALYIEAKKAHGIPETLTCDAKAFVEAPENSGRYALHVDPGLRIYSRNGGTDFMTRFPVGGVIGVQATPELRLAASADLAMAINWTHTAFFEIGPQFGLAGEYAVDRKLMFGLNTKFGPQFITLSGTGSQVAFTVQAVVGYRM